MGIRKALHLYFIINVLKYFQKAFTTVTAYSHQEPLRRDHADNEKALFAPLRSR